LALFGQQNIIINGDLETAEPFFWHPMNAGDGNSVLTWTDLESYQDFRSLKIFKPNVSSAAVGWISENNAQVYWNQMTDDVTYNLWGNIKTLGVNTSPTTDDERVGLLYKFFDASKALIAEKFVPADQSVASRDWHEVNGSVYIPAGSVPDSMICIVRFGKDAMGTAWFDMMDLWSDPWIAMIFGDEVETPQGWMYWTSPSLVGVAEYDDSDSHSGAYSAKLEENDSNDDQIVFYSIPVPVVPDKYYHVSAWIKTQGVNTDPSFTATSVTTYQIDERMGICFNFHEPPIETSWNLVPPGDLFFYIDQTVSSHDWRKYEVIWKAPAGAAGVSMRARFTRFPTGTAWFDDFSIRDVLNDSIIVIFPNGGETLPVGYDYDIAWTSTKSISDVKLEYSTNGGTSWEIIEASIPNDSPYTWTVPDDPSNDCLIHISDSIDEDPSDVSNGPFTIQSQQGLLGFEIYIIPPTGGVPTRVTNLPDMDLWNPCWSPDGAKIGHDVLTFSGGFMVSHGIYITDVATGISSPLVGAEWGNDCSWSPDGSQIAFDWDGIWIVPASGGTPTLLVEDARHPSWSSDGSRIVYYTAPGVLWTIPSSGGTPTQLTTGPTDSYPFWSPDGQWIAYNSNQGGNSDIWKIHVASNGSPIGAPIQITTHPSNDLISAWSPDGVEIAFQSSRSGNGDIWRIDASGGLAQQVTTSLCDDYNPAWSTDGQFIAYSSDYCSGEVNASVDCQDFSQGTQVVVPLTIDMSNMSAPDDKLGSFTGTIDWDTNVLTYISDSGILSGFTGNVVASSGHITFNGANPNGAGGIIDILNVTFQVVDDPQLCETSSFIDLEFSAMAAAFTFHNILPCATVNDCIFTLTCGILGDVNNDEIANSTDALIVLSCDVGINTSQFCPMNCGDVNEDGFINSTDALIILSYDVGMDVPFPVGEPGCPQEVTQCPGCN